jgi:hypothetical protein
VRADGRVEWKHHFAHLANRLAADPSAAASARPSSGRSAAPLGDGLGRPRRGGGTDHARPRRARIRHRNGCRGVPQAPPEATIVVVPRATTSRKSCPCRSPPSSGTSRGTEAEPDPARRRPHRATRRGETPPALGRRRASRIHSTPRV